jgi:hypothetical protein
MDTIAIKGERFGRALAEGSYLYDSADFDLITDFYGLYNYYSQNN